MLDKLARYSIIIVICNRNLGNYKRLLKLSFLFSRHMYKLRFFTVDPNDVLKWKKYTQFHFVFFKLSQNCSINPTFTTHTLVFSINLRILCRLSFFIFQRQGREGGGYILSSPEMLLVLNFADHFQIFLWGLEAASHTHKHCGLSPQIFGVGKGKNIANV